LRRQKHLLYNHANTDKCGSPQGPFSRATHTPCWLGGRISGALGHRRRFVIGLGGFADLTVPDLAQTNIRLISMAIIYASIYNSTSGNLFLVMAAYAGHNAGTRRV
jgi:hypothetical protein